jgi:serine/threonine protein kinase
MVLRSRARPRTYALGPRIAAGGMGEVYQAFSADLNRTVAVKRMLEAVTSEEDLKLMFLREVAVAATLEHHNVVEVLDAGQHGLELFLVMELVDGPSLAEVVEVLRRDNKILPIEVSCHIVSSVCQGLAHAHERALPDGTPLGIIHRDVAPENVLIGTDGVAKIVDFGLAKLSGQSLTQPGIIRGRPRSLSPEQARGDPVDVRSDIFSLGAMLFELCAGQPLYPNEAIASLLWKVAAGDYAPLEPRLAHIDPSLVEIIQTSLQVDPADRYRSTREFDRALEGFRAARAMRVSSRALAQVVTLTWPTIKALRQERMEGLAGELEGATLTLPADQSDMDNREVQSPLHPSGGYKIPQATLSTKPGPERGPIYIPPTPRPEQTTGPITRTGDLRSSLPPAAFTSELPKPRAPRRQVGEDGYRSQTEWRIYVALVMLLAVAAFGAAWAAGANATPAPTQAAHTAPTAQEGDP